MPLTESEARKRRILLKDALTFLNERSADKATFKRSDMFPTVPRGQNVMANWTREVVGRLVKRKKLTIVAMSKQTPIYQAISDVGLSEEEVSTYLRDGDAIEATTVVEEGSTDQDEGLQASASTPSATIPTNGASVIVPSAISAEGARPDASTDEMLAALIGILPDLVTAVNRIERKAVGIEAAMKKLAAVEAAVVRLEEQQKKILSDMADLVGIVYAEKK